MDLHTTDEFKENAGQLPFQNVVIAGPGTMGLGIAECCLQSGYRTWVVARNEGKALLARQAIEEYFRRRANKLHPDDELKAQQWLNTRLSKLQVGSNLAQSLARADLFIEAVVEDLQIKQDLFAKVEELARPGIILVTNTSSMRLADLGEKLKRPELLGGLHFFSPVPAMKIVEVIKSERTAVDVAQRLEAFGKTLEKVTIMCKDTPGFVINRMILPLLNIGHKLVDEGIATPEDIDVASKLGMNLPMGILSLSDLIGLDTIRNVNTQIMELYPGTMDLRPSETLDKLIAEGRLGLKTGCGFFDYAAKKKQQQPTK